MTTWTRIRRTMVASAAFAMGLASIAASASAATRAVSPCTASVLSAKVTGYGEGMSQPAAYITVTNTEAQSCSLKGYPSITSAATSQGRQAISVTNGAVMNAPESKPRLIVLAPGEQAWFAVGAGTAFDAPIVTFRRIAFTPSAGAGTLAVRVALQATAPSGKPFPLGVTAYAPGSSPPSA